MLDTEKKSWQTSMNNLNSWFCLQTEKNSISRATTTFPLTKPIQARNTPVSKNNQPISTFNF